MSQSPAVRLRDVMVAAVEFVNDTADALASVAEIISPTHPAQALSLVAVPVSAPAAVTATQVATDGFPVIALMACPAAHVCGICPCAAADAQENSRAMIIRTVLIGAAWPGLCRIHSRCWCQNLLI